MECQNLHAANLAADLKEANVELDCRFVGVKHGRLNAQQPQPPPRHCDRWFLIRMITVIRSHINRGDNPSDPWAVGLNCVLAMPKSSCNPSKRVEDTSLSLLTSTLIDSGSCARSLANGCPDPSSGLANAVGSTSMAGTSDCPPNRARLAFHGQSGRKPLLTSWPDVSTLSRCHCPKQDHGRSRNHRRRLLSPGFDASPTRMPRISTRSVSTHHQRTVSTH